MRFYGRERELDRIKREFSKLKNRSSAVVLVGRRRIGKTRLVFESQKQTGFLYFFVGKKSMRDLLVEWSEEIRSHLGDVFGEFTDFGQMLAYLFHKAKEREIIVFFDEVQNLLSVNPGAFSDLQKHFDINRESSSLGLIFAGSSYSMIEKIFSGAKEPLFGRATEFIRLGYLPVEVQKQILEDHGMYSAGNLLHCFSIFDGIPRFYEEIVETGTNDFKEALKNLMVEKEFLWEEGMNMMREEFGKDYSVYHSILSAIAAGKRTRNDIAQAANTSPGGYLQNLEKIYNLINKEKPVFSRTAKSGVQRYYLTDNFYEFWFRVISRFWALREINQKERAFDRVWESLPAFEGYKLETLIRRMIIERNPFELTFDRIGRHWDRTGENELDLVLVDDENRLAHVVEVKRNLSKAAKASEIRKLYGKIAAVPAFGDYEVTCYTAGLEENQIVIQNETGDRFVL